MGSTMAVINACNESILEQKVEGLGGMFQGAKGDCDISFVEK